MKLQGCKEVRTPSWQDIIDFAEHIHFKNSRHNKIFNIVAPVTLKKREKYFKRMAKKLGLDEIVLYDRFLNFIDSKPKIKWIPPLSAPNCRCTHVPVRFQDMI